VDGDRVLVIAVGDDSQCYNCGNAFLFDAVTGNLVHTFENPSPHEDHGFQAGSVAGDWVLMGVPNDDTTGYFSGRAYLFDAMTGNLVHTIENPTPDLGYDRFGSSVSVDGDRVLVGSIFDDNNGFYDNGSAYLFDAVTGNLVHTFENPSPDVSGRFGSGVSVVGDHVLVGAYHDDTTGDRSGRAFLFNALTGSLVHTFDNPSPDDYDYFGLNVSVADDWALVGVPNDDTTGAESGRAYLFELRGYTEATINIYDSVLHPRHGGSGSNQDDVIPVIVYGSSTLVGDLADLNTDDIDVSTLRFGPGMGSISPTAQSWFNFDVDSDGLDDAIFQFQMSDAAFDKVTCSDETGALVGDLTTGETFGGEDTFISDCNAGCH
jgi:hypothetical protein